MEHCSIIIMIYRSTSSFLFKNVPIIFNLNNFPSPFYADVFTGSKAGLPVTHMRSEQRQTTTIQSISDG